MKAVAACSLLAAFVFTLACNSANADDRNGYGIYIIGATKKSDATGNNGKQKAPVVTSRSNKKNTNKNQK